MSDFTVIRAVSRTLQELLRSHITESDDPQLSGVPIDLRSPKEMHEGDDEQGISLWLHRVDRMPDLINADRPRPAPDQRARRGIALELGYLVTPMHNDPEARQALLGRVIQVFNDWPALRGATLQDTLLGADDVLRVTLDSAQPPDPMGLWQALHMPYQLCLGYLVQHVTIDSERPPTQVPPVRRRESTYAQVVAP